MKLSKKLEIVTHQMIKKTTIISPHKMTNLNRRKGYLNNLLAQMTKNANLTTKVDQPKEDQAKVDPEAAQVAQADQADRVVD